MVLTLEFKSPNHDGHESFSTVEILASSSFSRGKHFVVGRTRPPQIGHIVNLWDKIHYIYSFQMGLCRFTKKTEGESIAEYLVQCIIHNIHAKGSAVEAKRYIIHAPWVAKVRSVAC